MSVFNRISKNNKRNLVRATEDLLRVIIEDTTQIKNNLPSNFDQVVPIGYWYGFLYESYINISDSEDETQKLIDIQKQIKKSLIKLFNRKQGKLLYKYSLLKISEDDDEKFNNGIKLAIEDLMEKDDLNEPNNLLKYYRGEIKD